MARVYYDELKATLSSTNLLDLLNSESIESQKENEMLASFNETTKATLTGEQYERFRSQFAYMINVLSTRKALAESMGSGIKEAIELLLNYMEGYAYLDSSKISEYQNARTRCVNSINEMNSLLQQQNRNDYATLQKNIELANYTISELDKIITKVQGLEPVYAQAQQILANAFSGISQFQNKVSSINPDGVYTYEIV
jgi:hypothetical protein